MNRILTIALAFSVNLAFGAEGSDTSSLTIQIDASVRGKPVSPLLYGIFVEDYNHSVTGGLYGEMLRNRSFEDRDTAREFTSSLALVYRKDDLGETNTPEGWRSVADSNGVMLIDRSEPLNAQNPTSLRLEVTKPGYEIINDGYWGMRVERGAEYKLSLYARTSPDFKGHLEAILQGQDGKDYAMVSIPDLAEGWQKFEYTLQSSTTDSLAIFKLRVQGTGKVWLDMVSLFPADTWKNRPNGVRADLAEMLAALRPGFVRFPGGCDLEGSCPANAWRWKQTMGDIAERPGRQIIWGYRASDGMGYHEYLEFCEDLKAEPILVVNAGMNCQGNGFETSIPLEELKPWIDDALDAIEYANGSKTSTWGALRAKNGHPCPFNMKYIEIGNENRGPVYAERYARFFDAIKTRYPKIKIIANERVTSRPFDILADHFYRDPDWLLKRSRQYDTAKREPWTIQIGEYSARGPGRVGSRSWRGALSEAALLLGAERNPDVVSMACHGAILSHARDPRPIWEPNVIYFSSEGAFGTPSYYVQKMLGNHRPDFIVPFNIMIPLETWPAPMGRLELDTIVATAGVRNQGRELILKAVNLSETARSMEVRIDGMKSRAFEVATTIMSAAPDDENSFASPFNVSPRQTDLGNVNEVFTTVLEPKSLSAFVLTRAANE
jgi:alpha-L-arabinofuranosidase